MLANLIRSSWRAWRRGRFNRALAKIYGPCPSCRRLILGHRVALLGTACPSLTETKEKDLREAVETGDWAAAMEIDEFDGLEDAVIVEAVRCPEKGRWAIFEFHSFFEPGVKDRGAVMRKISADEEAPLQSAVSGRLRPFGDSGLDDEAE